MKKKGHGMAVYDIYPVHYDTKHHYQLKKRRGGFQAINIVYFPHHLAGYLPSAPLWAATAVA